MQGFSSQVLFKEIVKIQGTCIKIVHQICITWLSIIFVNGLKDCSALHNFFPYLAMKFTYSNTIFACLKMFQLLNNNWLKEYFKNHKIWLFLCLENFIIKIIKIITTHFPKKILKRVAKVYAFLKGNC